MPDGFTVKPGDYWHVAGVWNPHGLRGKALTKEIKGLIDDQVKHALADPGVRRALRNSEADLERPIAKALKGARLGKLFHGTVRRVAQSPRVVGSL